VALFTEMAHAACHPAYNAIELHCWFSWQSFKAFEIED